MLIFLLVSIIVLCLIKLCFHTIDWKEIAVMTGVSLLVTILFWISMSFNYATWDREVWNGEISSKVRDKRDCPSTWSWQDSQDGFCTEYYTRQVKTGTKCDKDEKTGKSINCRDTYKTQYKYYYDWEANYMIYAKNIGGSWSIPRVDSQGATEPPAYAALNVGDPVSTTNSYTNWVKGAAESVFHNDGEIEEKYKDLLPVYPMQINDRLTIDRVLPISVSLPDIAAYNRQLSEALKQLGPKRQMNAIIVIADANKVASDFMYAVRRSWQGFKKNDAVIFIGVKDSKLVWADVLSWSKNNAFNVDLREAMLVDRDKQLDVSKIITNLTSIGMEKYERRPMEEFEFLKDEAPTPYGLITAFVLLQLLLLGGTTWFFHHNEL